MVTCDWIYSLLDPPGLKIFPCSRWSARNHLFICSLCFHLKWGSITQHYFQHFLNSSSLDLSSESQNWKKTSKIVLSSFQCIVSMFCIPLFLFSQIHFFSVCSMHSTDVLVPRIRSPCPHEPVFWWNHILCQYYSKVWPERQRPGQKQLLVCGKIGIDTRMCAHCISKCGVGFSWQLSLVRKTFLAREAACWLLFW